MICNQCGKNKATVHLTEIINDQVTKLDLCEACAKEKGSDVEQHFGIADLLAALSDVEVPGSSTAGSEHGVSAAAKIKCADCGMTYEDFKKIGRLGCGGCYTTFRASLTPLLKRIHGSNQHMGKSPSPVFVKEAKTATKLVEEIEAAKSELQIAVKKEEFEQAAAIRDKIKFLEKKIKETSKV